MSTVYSLTRGTLPLLLSVPHSGTQLSPGLAERLTEDARALPDTDWFVDELYGFAGDLGCSVLYANYSRYVVDLNRPSDGAALYPGQSETEICPTSSFSGEHLYRDSLSLAREEIDDRIMTYWHPYHRAIENEIDRLLHEHGVALLWDGHSIRSRVPRFFEGDLPELNLGTGGGSTCDSSIQESLSSIVEDSDYSHALNGRFKGGYITRHYGDPNRNVHAIQLEIAQRAYMHEDAIAIDNLKAPLLSDLLRTLLTVALETVV